MTTHYRRGADFERKVRDDLYARGAVLVIRSAGSRSPIDLAAFWPEMARAFASRVVLVQVKITGRLSAADRAHFAELARVAGAAPVIASPERVGRKVSVRYETID